MTASVDPQSLKDPIARIQYARWKARTDLFFLMRNVLGERYNKVDHHVHDPLIAMLQQFPMTWEESQDIDRIYGFDKRGNPKSNYFRPLNERKRLPGSRRRLILDSRSMGKTTLNAKAHTIQWLLNYPDIALAIIQASITKAEDILFGIKQIFLTNTNFRHLFPEFCPWEKGEIRDFGNRERFTLPNRRSQDRSEPSVMAGSIDKAMSGYHFEVMKHSDIVEPSNCKTDQSIADTIYMFDMYRNLLVDTDDWIDVEGTRYSYGDLYGNIIETEAKSEPIDREWTIFVRGIYKKKMPLDPKTGQPFPQRFVPEELDFPNAVDENGQFISWWPERFPTRLLEKERRASPEADEVFATQKLNNPLDLAHSERVFDLKYYKEKSPEDFAKVPIAYHRITIDTAETVSTRSDFSCITCCSYDGAGRCYVRDVRHGKMLPDELIETIFEMWLKYRPQPIQIEETGFVRGLKQAILRECQKKNVWPVFEYLKRDTQTSKADRIKNTLQPWYKAGEIIFLSNLPCKEMIRKEMNEFPKGQHDDILDTLADQFQNREYFGRNTMRYSMEEVRRLALDRVTLPPLNPWEDESGARSSFYDSTGGL